MNDKIKDEKPGTIHRALLENSERLQRVYHCLLRGPKTTREIIYETGTLAVNSTIDELRKPPNNIPIKCKCIRKGVYEYSIPKGQITLKL